MRQRSTFCTHGSQIRRLLLSSHRDSAPKTLESSWIRYGGRISSQSSSISPFPDGFFAPSIDREFPLRGCSDRRSVVRPSSITGQISRPFCSSSSSSGTLIPPDPDLHNAESEKVYEIITSNSSGGQDLEKALDALDLHLTTELVNTILQKLRYNEKLAFRFFTWAGNNPEERYSHERQTYNDMIDILSSTKYKARQFGVLCDVLDQIKRTNRRSLATDALLETLRAYAEKHLTHLHKFAKKRKIKPKIQPEVHALNLLLDSLCKCNLPSEAEALLRRVKNKLNPNDETYNVLFFGWCRARDPKKAMKLLEEMLEKGHRPESFTYNAAIDAFCGAGMIEEARELFEFMRTKGSTLSSPTAKTYSVMIRALAMADKIEACFELLAEMTRGGILPDVPTFKEMIQGLCRAGKMEDARKLFDEMGRKGYPPDVLSYNCFVGVLCELREEEEAVKLCEGMIEMGCEPSVHTYNMMMGMFFAMDEPERAWGMWWEMDRRRCARDAESYCVMMEGLFKCGRSDDACRLLDDVIGRGVKIPYRKFDSLLSLLSEVGNLGAIHRLSEHMRKFYNRAMARRFAITQKKKSAGSRRA
ncbi:pentatricopeptide repeat-containing protein At1g73400, mitochondrial-like [Wolffia australiana]